jgi:group I intron endonuclease
MEERNHCVYMHRNKINGKKYIGQAKGNPENRWKKGYKGCTCFYNAIKKYGWNNFEHLILLDDLTIDEANICEKEFIKLLKTTDRQYGYNIQYGGKNGNHSLETRAKISASNIGKHKNFGKDNYFYGKTHTQETIAIIRAKNIGRAHSQEEKAKRRKSLKGKQAGILHSNIKPVLQFDKNGNFIREWQYINQARDCLGIDPSTIVRCCKGRQQTAGGYIWKYK